MDKKQLHVRNNWCGFQTAAVWRIKCQLSPCFQKDDRAKRHLPKAKPYQRHFGAVSQSYSNYWIFRTPEQAQALSSLPWTWREDSTGKRCPILWQGEEPLLEHGIALTCTGGPSSPLRIYDIIRRKRVQIFSRPHGKWICVCSIKGVTVTSNMQESTQVTVDVSALLPRRLGCSEYLQDFFFLPFLGSLLILWILPCGREEMGWFLSLLQASGEWCYHCHDASVTWLPITLNPVQVLSFLHARWCSMQNTWLREVDPWVQWKVMALWFLHSPVKCCTVAELRFNSNLSKGMWSFNQYLSLQIILWFIFMQKI